MPPSADIPFGFSSGGGIPDDVAAKIPLFAELRKLLAAEGPVNWELARQLAIAAVAGPEPSAAAEVDEAVRIADVWLDAVTTLPTGVTTVAAWTRVDWVERTLPVWKSLCDPVASRVVAAMRGALPEEVREQAGPLIGMFDSIGGLMFGAQVGQALGTLAGEVVSSTDVGIPLGPDGVAALLPRNVEEFGAGLEIPLAEVRLYLALREAAHRRLFAHVPWLRAHLLAAVEAYARGISVDHEAIGRAMAEIDPANPESLQRALGDGLFQPESTPEQQAALARLETALAVVEGWVDAVVTEAAAGRLPSAGALGETLRRRRATGGPAEQTFATLVGLELRPRRLRDASTLWRLLGERRGMQGRDAVWAHPDLMPGSADLDDPQAYADAAPPELEPPTA